MRNEVTFCMDIGQVRSGNDKDDTFIRMLQQLTRLTPNMARGIASVYPGLKSLVCAMREQGPLLLEDIMVCRNWILLPSL